MDRADVLILGGGLVGSALAVAADAHGITSIAVDPADPAVITAAGFDGRASAIASAPMNMLYAIGVADRLAGKGCPIEGIRVSDGLAPGALDFVPQDGEKALGTMFENRDLRTALLDAAGAAAVLGVKPATLYSYVSRGLLTRQQDPKSRRSLFRPQEVEALRRQSHPARPSGEEVTFESAITVLGEDRPFYRGVDALTFSLVWRSVYQVSASTPCWSL